MLISIYYPRVRIRLVKTKNQNVKGIPEKAQNPTSLEMPTSNSFKLTSHFQKLSLPTDKFISKLNNDICMMIYDHLWSNVEVYS